MNAKGAQSLVKGKTKFGADASEALWDGPRKAPPVP